jgi:hypothetical protein
MNLNYFEEVTEKVLLELGISQHEYDGFIILMLAMFFAVIIGSWVYLRLTCKYISCEKMQKVFRNSEKVAEAIDRLEKSVIEIHHIDTSDHGNIKDNIDKVDSAIGDVKSKVAELNGIMIVSSTYASTGRRRIEHEND